jgi:hypothetical protein
MSFPCVVGEQALHQPRTASTESPNYPAVRPRPGRCTQERRVHRLWGVFVHQVWEIALAFVNKMGQILS